MSKFLDGLWARAAEVAPTAGLVVLVIVVGLILSAVARRVVRWLTRKSGLEALAEKVGVAKPLYAIGAKDGIAELLGRVAYFAGLLLTLSAVADILQLQAVATVTALAVQFLPRILSAAAVLLGGMAVAALLRNLLRAMGRKRDDVDAPDFVAQLAYYTVVTVAITLAADQAGLETDIVEALIIIVVGISLASVGLSFALGARGVFRNLTARHYCEQVVRPGDHIVVGDVSGVVVRFTAIAVVVRTEAGRQAVVPCERLLQERLEVDPAHDSDSIAPPDAD